MEEQIGNAAPRKLWSHADPLAKRVVNTIIDEAERGKCPGSVSVFLFW